MLSASARHSIVGHGGLFSLLLSFVRVFIAEVKTVSGQETKEGRVEVIERAAVVEV